MINSNMEGIPEVVWTSRHAPVSERLRTVHGTAWLPRRIFPDLSIRIRFAFRCSSMAATGRSPDRARIGASLT